MGALRARPQFFADKMARVKGMKRVKTKPGRKGAKRPTAVKGSRKPVNLADVREQIAARVGHDALDMVETTIEEAGKGHYLAMKYLFEMIGLYPATAPDEALPEDSMVRTLLRRLGLPEEPAPEDAVTKDSRAEVPAAASDTVE